MAPDDVPISDWLDQGTSDPGQVADRYDKWAKGYDDDLSSWSYQAPAVVADTSPPVIRSRARCSTSGAAPARRASARARGSPERSSASTSRRRHSTSLGRRGAYDSVEQADLQQRLPLEDDSVDAVVCVGVMTYLPDVEAVWREFARVVRPGGLVVATQREELWGSRECQGVIDRLQREGVWTPVEIAGPAPYLPGRLWRYARGRLLLRDRARQLTSSTSAPLSRRPSPPPWQLP